jgi:hypothetical protein
MSHPDLEARRRPVRRRALANTLVVLLEQAARSGGRLEVTTLGADALALCCPGVRTLVRRPPGFAFARRDFVVALVFPPAWPFERAAAVRFAVLQPEDWAAPNSDGHAVCVDTAGVEPARLARVVHDNLRLARFRLDHVVDPGAAAFVRSHLSEFPADPMPLWTGSEEGERVDDPTPSPGASEGAPGTPGRDDGLTALLGDLRCTLPAIDLPVGVLAATAPRLTGATFLRLAGCAGSAVDRARVAFLRAAAGGLRAAAPGWADGPGLAVEPATADPALLAAEIGAVARALALLADERVAASYLAMTDGFPTPKGG